MPGQHEHQGHRADQANHTGNRREQRVHCKALDLGNIAIEPRKNVTDALTPVERRRQLLQVAIQVIAQGKQNASGQACMQVAVDARQQHADNPDGDHDQRHLPEHLEVLGQQALVDQGLDQPGLHQHQQRSRQGQPEQYGYRSPVRAHEAVQPGQRVAHQLRVGAVDQPEKNTAHQQPLIRAVA
ncbi:hypothetical protein D3C80_1160530 [compost metagenome]